MATKTKAKAKAAKTAERADLVEKDPTQLHQDFATYIAEQTGYEPDAKTVQLATILRMDFQRSESNQARIAARKQAKADAEAARQQKKAEKAAAKTEKATAKKTAPAAKKTAGAKKSTAKKAPTRRRAKAAATEESF